MNQHIEINFKTEIRQHLAANGWRYAESQRGIDLLRERRTALISAAVTGQIDVRKT